MFLREYHLMVLGDAVSLDLFWFFIAYITNYSFSDEIEPFVLNLVVFIGRDPLSFLVPVLLHFLSSVHRQLSDTILHIADKSIVISDYTFHTKE